MITLSIRAPVEEVKKLVTDYRVKLFDGFTQVCSPITDENDSTAEMVDLGERLSIHFNVPVVLHNDKWHHPRWVGVDEERQNLRERAIAVLIALGFFNGNNLSILFNVDEIGLLQQAEHLLKTRIKETTYG